MSALRPYEVMYIVRPTLNDDQVQDVAQQYRQFVIDAGGEVERLELVGLRRLAYEINHVKEGIYILMLFRAPSTLIQPLKRELRLDERVVREMLILRTGKALAMEARAAEALAAEPEGAPEAEPEGLAAVGETPEPEDAAVAAEPEALEAPAGDETPEPEDAAVAAEPDAPEAPAGDETPEPEEGEAVAAEPDQTEQAEG